MVDSRYHPAIRAAFDGLQYGDKCIVATLNEKDWNPAFGKFHCAETRQEYYSELRKIASRNTYTSVETQTEVDGLSAELMNISKVKNRIFKSMCLFCRTHQIDVGESFMSGCGYLVCGDKTGCDERQIMLGAMYDIATTMETCTCRGFYRDISECGVFKNPTIIKILMKIKQQLIRIKRLVGNKKSYLLSGNKETLNFT
jgi:hypothetical protein